MIRRMNSKLLTILFFIFFTLFLTNEIVFAVSVKEVENQIDTLNEQILNIDKEIAKYEKQILETGRQKTHFQIL